ncbi:macro domain-containing protein CT2219-like [Panulirus ornatus]|uniref:macro domain-containing protein CT2219-like n=1 Tax=Panulirus ornatus TaxID=150431 RepID=UPI003A8B4FD5
MLAFVYKMLIDSIVWSRLSSGLKVFSGVIQAATRIYCPSPRHRIQCVAARTVNYTTSLKMLSFESEKRKCLAMSVEERRRRYKVHGHFTELHQLDTWDNYYKKNKYICSKVALDQAAIASVLQGSCYKVDNDLNQKISLFMGDITKLEVDAVVNAANNTLSGGGGVDGAIHKAAGQFLDQECFSLNGCETGNAKITGGYNLPARYVIHTVGPIGEKPAMLESCYKRSMQIAIENNIRTIAFPCISTGVYGYPSESAVTVVLPIIRTMLEAHKNKIDRVIFCLFVERDIHHYHRYLPIFFPLQ